MKLINFVNKLKISETQTFILSLIVLIIVCVFISKTTNVREYLSETDATATATVTGISAIPQSNALTSNELSAAQSQNSINVSTFNQSMINSIGPSEKSKMLIEAYNSINNHDALFSIYDNTYIPSKINIVSSNSILENLVTAVTTLNRHELEIMKLSENTYYPCERLKNINLNEVRANYSSSSRNTFESYMIYVILEIIDYHDFIIQKISEKYASRISTAYYRIHS